MKRDDWTEFEEKKIVKVMIFDFKRRLKKDVAIEIDEVVVKKIIFYAEKYLSKYNGKYLENNHISKQKDSFMNVLSIIYKSGWTNKSKQKIRNLIDSLENEYKLLENIKPMKWETLRSHKPIKLETLKPGDNLTERLLAWADDTEVPDITSYSTDLPRDKEML